MNLSKKAFLASLRSRIIALCVLVAFLSASTIGIVSYFRLSKLTFNLAIDTLEQRTLVTLAYFNETFHTMKGDAQIVANTPPIEGLIRASKSGGIDPVDGSTEAHWRTRLETIFVSIMKTRPYYTQMRYIGLADEGRELVRVNRRGLDYERVLPSDLQSKAQEPYFQMGLNLSSGSHYFSEVTFNREHGQIDPSLTPTIRIIIPIFEAPETKFGFVVINADYDQIINHIPADLPESTNILISNHSGDYFLYDSSAKSITIREYTLSANYTPHQVVNDSLSNPNLSYIINDGMAYYRKRATLNTNLTDNFIDVYTTTPHHNIVMSANKYRFNSLIFILLLTLFIMLAAVFIAQRITRPLSQMQSELMRFQRQASHHHQSIENLNFPVKSQDEIGELARTFQSLLQSLQESDLKTNAILDSMTDALIVVDLTGQITRINPSTESLLHASETQLVGDYCQDYFPDFMPVTRSGTRAEFLHCIHESIGDNFETQLATKDGRSIPCEISINEIILPDKDLFCILLRDISERKQIDKLKNEFISTVNHEIRTPLTSIFGSLGLLKIKTKNLLDTKTFRLIDIAHNSCERLSLLVNDILDLEKIAAGKIEYDMEVVDIAHLVQDILDRHIALAEKHNVTFATQIDVDHAFVNLDPNRFNQALVNLLSNAAKFSPLNGRVNVVVQPHTAQHIRISVSDHGPGIPKDFRDKVFDRFTQADNSNTRNEGSSGLGLHITKTLIEAFGGSVSFDTIEGKGTTFHFILPLSTGNTPEDIEEA